MILTVVASSYGMIQYATSRTQPSRRPNIVGIFGFMAEQRSAVGIPAAARQVCREISMAKKKKGDKKKKRDKSKKKQATVPVPSNIGASQPRLELLAETKLEHLLEQSEQSRFEASGLHYKDGYLYIVLDNAPQIVRVRTEIDTASIMGDLIELHGAGEGYEAITFQPREGRWYCLVESAKTRESGFKPGVDVYDVTFAHLESFWLDYEIESDNKGFEGLSSIRYRGEELLLGLCEGNDCKGGKAGRTPGKGRIQLFRRAPNTWAHVDTVKLPSSVRFEDYADLDIHGRHVTVLSQATSAVWVGRGSRECRRFGQSVGGRRLCLSLPPRCRWNDALLQLGGNHLDR